MTLPCALSVAGLDPSGGAGLLADARAITAAGAWPCGVAAVLTVQSTAGLERVMPVAPDDLRAQADAVFAHQRVRAWKTGALGSAANVRVALALAEAHPDIPLVVDPVMIATRGDDGARLLDPEALDAMRALCARATLVTPNIDEAEALLDRPVRTLVATVDAARELVAMGAQAALVKGGHLTTEGVSDTLCVRGRTEVFTSRRVAVEFHGGGCSLSAYVTGALALGVELRRAVKAGKRAISKSVARAEDVGDGLRVLPVR